MTRDLDLIYETLELLHKKKKIPELKPGNEDIIFYNTMLVLWVTDVEILADFIGKYGPDGKNWPNKLWQKNETTHPDTMMPIYLHFNIFDDNNKRDKEWGIPEGLPDREKIIARLAYTIIREWKSYRDILERMHK